MRILTEVILTGIVVLCIVVLTSDGQEPKYEGLGAVSGCQLLQNAKDWNGKMVRVDGIYLSSFELSELLDPSCYDPRTRIWVSFELDDRGEKSKANKRLASGTTFRVLVVGTFHSEKRHYGHENGYSYQLTISKVEKSRRLSKGEPPAPATLAAAMKEEF